MPKTMNNLLKIDAKSMLEKGMQKLAKMEPKWTTMGAQIGPKSRKSRKKGMQKMMLKLDSEKNEKMTDLMRKGRPWMAFLARPGVRGLADSGQYR